MTGYKVQDITVQDIKAAVHDILDGADLNSWTASQVVTAAADKLGQDADKKSFKQQNQVEKFVSSQAQPDKPTNSGKKRSAVAAQSEGSTPKVAKQSKATEAGSELDVPLTEDGLKRCRLRDFKGAWYVDLRTFYQADGEPKPSKRGVMLSAPEWRKLAAGLSQLAAALAEEQADCVVELSATRRAAVSDFKEGELVVDVREWYEKDGEMKPGQKGISLPDAAFQALQSNSQAITDKLGALAAAAPKKDSDAAAPARAAAQAAHEIPATAAETSGIDVAGAEKSGAGETIYRLGAASSKKFAGASDFKGKRMVSLREHYQKGGEGPWLPGAKGISLAAEQFDSLHSNAEAVSDAFRAVDTDFSLELTEKRKVNISVFKGTNFVNIREYYTDKSGHLAPGKKGIALDAEQWQSLTQVLGSLKEQLHA